jgi:hypothetical protein
LDERCDPHCEVEPIESLIRFRTVTLTRLP